MAKNNATPQTEETKTPAKEETPEKIKKKRSLVVLGGIGVSVLISLGVAAFFVHKTFFAHKTELSAKKDPVADAKSKATEGAKQKDTSKHIDEDEKSGHASKPEGSKAEGSKLENSKSESPKPEDSKSGAHGESQNTQKKEGADTEAKSANKNGDKKESSFGDTYEVQRMDLNLGNPIENRFLRIGFSLQFFGGDAQKDEIKKREPQIKDILITSVSNRTRVELVNEKGKEKLRRELLNRFNEAFDKPIKNIFFTEFLVE
jgi:flagellar basal body-associated protein FliL